LGSLIDAKDRQFLDKTFERLEQASKNQSAKKHHVPVIDGCVKPDWWSMSFDVLYEVEAVIGGAFEMIDWARGLRR
jgi:hypothetical protein